ncbi:MAG: cell division topological specificity factor MinE [Anaerolineaceae bacterium]|jgi:cell division topological specificity factor
MSGFVDKLLSRNPNSASTAKERLQLVLIHDRTDLTPTQLDTLRNELIDVISKYVNIDRQAVRINMSQEGREQRLIADIPLKSATKRR